MYLTQVTIEAQVEEEDLRSRVPTNEIAYLDQLEHRNIPLDPLDPLDHLYCLTNHQETYQKSLLTLWDTFDVPLDPQIKPEYQETSRLDFCIVYPWSCLKFIILSTSPCGPFLANLV